MWAKLVAGTLVIGLVASVAWLAGIGDDATAIRPIVVTSSEDREDRPEPSADIDREPQPARSDDPNDRPDDEPVEATGSSAGGGGAPQHDDTDDDEREDDDDDSDDD